MALAVSFVNYLLHREAAAAVLLLPPVIITEAIIHPLLTAAVDLQKAVGAVQAAAHHQGLQGMVKDKILHA